jgi:hypothetical protein
MVELFSEDLIASYYLHLIVPASYSFSRAKSNKRYWFVCVVCEQINSELRKETKQVM